LEFNLRVVFPSNTLKRELQPNPKTEVESWVVKGARPSGCFNIRKACDSQTSKTTRAVKWRERRVLQSGVGLAFVCFGIRAGFASRYQSLLIALGGDTFLPPVHRWRLC
jgi:hypothetical protein